MENQTFWEPGNFFYFKNWSTIQNKSLQVKEKVEKIIWTFRNIFFHFMKIFQTGVYNASRAAAQPVS